MQVCSHAGGPYHIATAEKQLLPGKTRGRVYWKVVPDGEDELQYRIGCTSDRDVASNFYLKPFEGKYFLIATDPEDLNSRKEEESTATNQPSDCSTPAAGGVSTDAGNCSLSLSGSDANEVADKHKASAKVSQTY